MITDLQHCARCGNDHTGIEWLKLTVPIEDDDGTVWAYWAPCPTNGEPILMKVSET
jgi:hypothetical protein